MGKKHNEEWHQKIFGVLDGWSGPLTWPKFLKAIEPLVGEYTYPGMRNHSRIIDAYNRRKEKLKKNDGNEASKSVPNVKLLLQRIDRLEAEKARLQEDNDLFYEQFIKWSVNAFNKGISEAQLNATLTPIDRDRTKELSKDGQIGRWHN